MYIFKEQLKKGIYSYNVHTVNTNFFLSLMSLPKYKIKIVLQEMIYYSHTKFQGKNLESFTLASNFWQKLPDY